MQSCKTCVCCRCTLAVGNGHWSAMKALPREAEMEVQNSQVFFVFLLPHYFLISCMRSNVVVVFRSVVFLVCVCVCVCVSGCGYTDHAVSLGTNCSYENYEHNYVMSMNNFEPKFYLTVRLIMHSGVESVGICCSSPWWLLACCGRTVDSVKFVLPCRCRDIIHPYFLIVQRSEIQNCSNELWRYGVVGQAAESVNEETTAGVRQSGFIVQQ